MNEIEFSKLPDGFCSALRVHRSLHVSPLGAPVEVGNENQSSGGRVLGEELTSSGKYLRAIQKLKGKLSTADSSEQTDEFLIGLSCAHDKHEQVVPSRGGSESEKSVPLRRKKFGPKPLAVWDVSVVHRVRIL